MARGGTRRVTWFPLSALDSKVLLVMPLPPKERSSVFITSCHKPETGKGIVYHSCGTGEKFVMQTNGFRESSQRTNASMLLAASWLANQVKPSGDVSRSQSAGIDL